MADFVPVSRREIQPQSPRVGQEAFGGGTARALSALGQTLAQAVELGEVSKTAENNLQLAYRRRQEKVDRANASVELIRLETELTREITQLKQDSAPGAPNLLDDVTSLVDKRANEFLSQLPEPLRQEFAPSVERLRNARLTDALNTKVSAENSKFVNDTQRIVQGFSEAIFTFEGDPQGVYDKMVERLQELYLTSPLDGTTAEQLFREDKKVLDRALLAREAQDEALDEAAYPGTVPGALKREGRVVKSATMQPVAAGLPAPANAFLSMLLEKESDGEYNVMYSPQGGGRRYFDSFAKHPNLKAIITEGPEKGRPSTAAGGYGFLYNTWQEVVEDLRVEDFSPENQDRGAWYIAKKRYAQLTDGQNLEVVFRSGNPVAIEKARKLLLPTWPSLAKFTPQEFFDRLASAQSTPSSLVYDERFGDIPLAERMQIVAGAEANANNIRLQMVQEANAERARLFEEMQQRIRAGDPTLLPNVIEQQGQEAGFTAKQLDQLQAAYEEKNANVLAASRYISTILDPAKIPDPTSKEWRTAATAYFDEIDLPAVLDSGDPELIAGNITRPLLEGRYIPDNLKAELIARTEGQDPQRAVQAYELLGVLQAEAPGAFGQAFSDAEARNVALFNSLKESLPAEVLLQRVRNLNDPALASFYEMNRRKFDSLVADANYQVFSVERVASVLGASDLGDDFKVAAVMDEYIPLVKFFFEQSGDIPTAEKAAAKVLSQRFGEEKIAGRKVFMKNPPSKFYPPFKGGYEYIGEQLLSEVKVPDGTVVELISDSRTDQQVAQGQPPTYAIMRMNEYGIPVPVTYGETTFRDQFAATISNRMLDALVDQPARFRPEITQEMVEQLARDEASVVKFDPELAEQVADIQGGLVALGADPRALPKPPEARTPEELRRGVDETPEVTRKLKEVKKFAKVDVVLSQAGLSDKDARRIAGAITDAVRAPDPFERAKQLRAIAGELEGLPKPRIFDREGPLGSVNMPTDRPAVVQALLEAADAIDGAAAVLETYSQPRPKPRGTPPQPGPVQGPIREAAEFDNAELPSRLLEAQAPLVRINTPSALVQTLGLSDRRARQLQAEIADALRSKDLRERAEKLRAIAERVPEMPKPRGFDRKGPLGLVNQPTDRQGFVQLLMQVAGAAEESVADLLPAEFTPLIRRTEPLTDEELRVWMRVMAEVPLTPTQVELVKQELERLQ